MNDSILIVEDEPKLAKLLTTTCGRLDMKRNAWRTVLMCCRGLENNSLPGSRLT